MVKQHATTNGKPEAIESFVYGEQNTFYKYVKRVLARNHCSEYKIFISQSIPTDWHNKAEENASRIRLTFSLEKVNVTVNADETFLLFHPLGERLIAPTRVKCVGTAMQVDDM
jgi:hypothetical protein